MNLVDSVKMEYDEAMKDLESKVLKLIDEIHAVSEEYCKWDEWDKAQYLSDANAVLMKKYEEPYVKEFLKHEAEKQK